MKYYNLKTEQILKEAQKDVGVAIKKRNSDETEPSLSEKNKIKNNQKFDGYKLWGLYVDSILERNKENFLKKDTKKGDRDQRFNRFNKFKNLIKNVLNNKKNPNVFHEYNEQTRYFISFLRNDIKSSNQKDGTIKKTFKHHEDPKEWGNLRDKKTLSKSEEQKAKNFKIFLETKLKDIEQIIKTLPPATSFENDIRSDINNKISEIIQSPNNTLGKINVKINASVNMPKPEKPEEEEVKTSSDFSDLLRKGIELLKYKKDPNEVIKILFNDLKVHYAKLFKQDTSNIITNNTGKKIGIEIKRYNPEEIEKGVVFAELVALEKSGESFKNLLSDDGLEKKYSEMSKLFVYEMIKLLKDNFKEQLRKKKDRDNFYLAIGTGLNNVKFFSIKDLLFDIKPTGRGGKTAEGVAYPYRFTIMVSSKKEDGKGLEEFKKEINDRIQNDSVEKYLGDFLIEILQ